MAKNRYTRMTLEEADKELKENKLLYAKSVKDRNFKEESRLNREQKFLMRRLGIYVEDPCPLDTVRNHMNCELCTGYFKPKKYILNPVRKTNIMTKKSDTGSILCHLKKKWKGII